MLRPRALHDDLAHDDLATVKNAGIDTVISLLEPEEAKTLGLEGESAACEALGLTFLSYPIRDMHLPEAQDFTAFGAQIADRLRDGAQIALHCRGSIGRSGMLACAVLGQLGYTAEAAIAHVSNQRGVSIPDTDTQAAFIRKISGS